MTVLDDLVVVSLLAIEMNYPTSLTFYLYIWNEHDPKLLVLEFKFDYFCLDGTTFCSFLTQTNLKTSNDCLI